MLLCDITIMLGYRRWKNNGPRCYDCCKIGALFLKSHDVMTLSCDRRTENEVAQCYIFGLLYGQSWEFSMERCYDGVLKVILIY